MIFQLTTPDENHDIFRAASEKGLYSLGIRSVLFGYRVCLSHHRASHYSLDYCCGNCKEAANYVTALVALILRPIKETISPSALEKLFPVGTFKPIDRDPVLAKLQVMAGVSPLKYKTCTTCGRASYEGDRPTCCGVPINNTQDQESIAQ